MKQLQHFDIPRDLPILIAGPTASGKSELALKIAETHGGIILNADASQVYGCWRVITARPSPEDEARAPHALYGHIAHTETYSTGHWLREVQPYLHGAHRPIIVGGTGLYFSSLTKGIAEIPPIPPEIRAKADKLPLEALIDDLDHNTRNVIDTLNRARVQRAYEVFEATGKSIAEWHAETPPAPLSVENAFPIVVNTTKDWLNDRISRRFDQMISMGAIDEIRTMITQYDPNLPAFRAIGVPELTAYLKGTLTIDQARERATISTRQYAKRQRTWFRSKMRDWHSFEPEK